MRGQYSTPVNNIGRPITLDGDQPHAERRLAVPHRREPRPHSVFDESRQRDAFAGRPALGLAQNLIIQIEGCLHHQPAIPYMRLNHIAVQEAPIAVSTTTTRSRLGWHSIGVSTPSQRPARPRPRLSRFPLVHRMIHLHRPDHRVDAAPLECVRRRGLGPVDTTKLRVSLAQSSMCPFLLRACAYRSSTSASRSSVSSRNASENRATGASRQATDIRGKADYMPAPLGRRSLRHGQFRLILGGSYR